MLSQYISVFQGFFSRAFWFGSFLPAALFAFVHLAIAWLAFGDAVPLVAWLKEDQSKLTLFPAIFVALVVLGYVLSPMVSLFRDLLDGSALPTSWHDVLRDGRTPALRTISDEVDTAEKLLGLCTGYTRRDWAQIENARQKGDRTNTTSGPDIVAAANAVATLREGIDSGTFPIASDIEDGHDTLVSVLSVNNSNLRDGTPAARLSTQLNEAREAFKDVVGDCAAEAAYQVSALHARYGRVAFRNPQATRMADARFLAESYSLNAYNVDFSYLWPRLQAALPDQGAQGAVDSYNDRLISARARVDFAVLCTVLAVTVPLVWLTLLIWHGSSVLLFLTVGILGPLVAMFFYQLAVESQFEFGEAIKSAIDKYRFNVLSELRLSLPPTLRAERELWGELRVVEQIGAATDLFYRHPPPASAGGQRQ